MNNPTECPLGVGHQQSFGKKPSVNYGWMMKLPDSAENELVRQGWSMFSKDAPNLNEPYLTIEYIPEPVSLALLGLGGLAAVRRRK